MSSPLGLTVTVFILVMFVSACLRVVSWLRKIHEEIAALRHDLRRNGSDTAQNPNAIESLTKEERKRMYGF